MKTWGWVMAFVLSSGVPAYAMDTAESVVRNAVDDIYQALNGGCQFDEPGSRELHRQVDRLLLPHADLEGMSRWVMGKHWRRASDAQRKAFTTEFSALLIRTYATAIREVSPEEIDYLPRRKAADKDKTVVRTMVRRAGAEVFPIDYYMHRKTGRWLVYDVRVEGISLVTNYRTSFAAEISAHGVAGLIARLQHKNKQPQTTENIQLAHAGNC